MGATIQLRRDTLENWLKYDPVLLDGEEVLIAGDSANPGRYIAKKIGDGVTKFSLLPEFSLSGEGGEGSGALPRIPDITFLVRDNRLCVRGSEVLPTDTIQLYRKIRLRHKTGDERGHSYENRWVRFSETDGVILNSCTLSKVLVEDIPSTYICILNYKDIRSQQDKRGHFVEAAEDMTSFCADPTIKTGGYYYLPFGNRRPKVRTERTTGETSLQGTTWGVQLVREGRPITGIVPFRVYTNTLFWTTGVHLDVRVHM